MRSPDLETEDFMKTGGIAKISLITIESGILSFTNFFITISTKISYDSLKEMFLAILLSLWSSLFQQ